MKHRLEHLPEAASQPPAFWTDLRDGLPAAGNAAVPGFLRAFCASFTRGRRNKKAWTGEESGRRSRMTDMPALPPFQPDPYTGLLTAAVDLPAWREVGGAVDFPRQPHLPSGGALQIVLLRPGGQEGEAPTAEETARVLWILGREQALRDAFLSGVLEAYPGIREEYAPDFDPPERHLYLPEVVAAGDLGALLRPTGLLVHPVGDGQDVYVGVEADCTWDQEHGLGVILRGLRGIHVGSAEHASQTWIIEQKIKEAGQAP